MAVTVPPRRMVGLANSALVLLNYSFTLEVEARRNSVQLHTIPGFAAFPIPGQHSARIPNYKQHHIPV